MSETHTVQGGRKTKDEKLKRTQDNRQKKNSDERVAKRDRGGYFASEKKTVPCIHKKNEVG